MYCVYWTNCRLSFTLTESLPRHEIELIDTKWQANSEVITVEVNDGSSDVLAFIEDSKVGYYTVNLS